MKESITSCDSMMQKEELSKCSWSRRKHPVKATKQSCALWGEIVFLTEFKIWTNLRQTKRKHGFKSAFGTSTSCILVTAQQQQTKFAFIVGFSVTAQHQIQRFCNQKMFQNLQKLADQIIWQIWQNHSSAQQCTMSAMSLALVLATRSGSTTSQFESPWKNLA